MRPCAHISYIYFLSGRYFTIETICSRKAAEAKKKHIFEEYEKWAKTNERAFKKFLERYKTGEFRERYEAKY